MGQKGRLNWLWKKSDFLSALRIQQHCCALKPILFYDFSHARTVPCCVEQHWLWSTRVFHDVTYVCAIDKKADCQKEG